MPRPRPRTLVQRQTIRTGAALAVCRSCPVIDECRAFADDNNRISGYPLQGIWGGKQYGRTSRPRKERE